MESQSSIILLWLCVVILIIIAGLYSSAEMALSSANRIKIKHAANKGDKKSKKVLKIIENYDKTLTTIIIANNIAYVILTTILSIIFTIMFVENVFLGTIISIIFSATVILILGELFPKSYAKSVSEKHLVRLLPFLLVTNHILYPITYVFTKINKFLKNKFINIDEDEQEFIEEEILTLIDEQSDDIIDKQEKQLIRNALEFDNTIVEEIQKPRVEIIAFDINTPIKEILKIFKKNKLSRIPVYNDNIDNVIGVLLERKLLEKVIENKKIDLKKIIKKPIFIPGTMKISNLLLQLQKSKVHIAMVMDESGGVQGIVTMEDILEELVGEIWDEHDDIQIDIKKIGKKIFQVSGDVLVEDFYKKIKKIPLDSIESVTMAGFIQEKIQKMPKKNKEYKIDDMIIKVIEIKKRQIKMLEITLKKIK